MEGIAIAILCISGLILFFLICGLIWYYGSTRLFSLKPELQFFGTEFKEEHHLDGGRYRYCGPGTHLGTRTRRGDLPINAVDACCQAHDAAYSNPTNPERVRRGDEALIECINTAPIQNRREALMGRKIQKAMRLKMATEDLGVIPRGFNNIAGNLPKSKK